ncbi:MAG: hypothetical protein K2K67_02715 [Treponemataceae bacterium]|nr:hypothetical protein [Treponemataceae bacterium]
MLRAEKTGICAALVLGMCGLLGCSGETGDENISPGGQGSQKDPESYIFLRHRFAEENATIHNAGSTATKLAWSNKHFNDAKAYMLQKVADFKNKVYNSEPNGNFLQAICNEAFVNNNGKPYDGFGSAEIDPSLAQNNLNYSKFLGAINAKITAATGTDVDYPIFEACYSMLAVRSYNDSLGYLKDSPNLKLNKEKSVIAEDLQRLGVSYSANNYNNVEFRLNNLLETASKKTGVSVETLQDAVNLSLLNASLWGARDLAASAGFQLSSNKDVLQYPSNQISNLNRDDLVHNMGSFWLEYYTLEKKQQNDQDLTK